MPQKELPSIDFLGGIMDGAKVMFERGDQIPKSLTIHSSITNECGGKLVQKGMETPIHEHVADINHVYNLDYNSDGTVYYGWNQQGEIQEC